MKKYIFILTCFIFLISCESDELFLSPSNDKVLELAYDNTYQYPEGFYHETTLAGYVYYENTVSVKPFPERENSWIELNTNDKEQARIWSNLSNKYSSVDRKLVKENETEKYFEFVRVNMQNEKDKLLSRVHRSDYFIPLYDRFTNIGVVGIYKGELSTDKVKELVEYLWSCGSLSIYDKVIESKITEKENKFEYYIQSLSIVYGDFGLYDKISVYDNIIILDTSYKLLSINRKLVQEIQGKYHKGW